MCFCLWFFVVVFPKEISGLPSPLSVIRVQVILVRKLLHYFRTDDSAPTFISSVHNLTLQAQMLQLSFQLQSKSVLCIKGQDRVLSCELQEYKYFLAIGLLLSGVSS